MGPTETVTRLLDYWARKYGMVQGHRNANLLILAQWMNEHGVPQPDALDACLPMQDLSGSDRFTAAEIRQVVASAYRRTVTGSNAWITGARHIPPPMPQRRTLSVSDRATLVELFAKAMRQEQERAVAITAPQVAEQVPATARTASPTSASMGELAVQRMAERNPAVNLLVSLFDLDIVNSRVRID